MAYSEIPSDRHLTPRAPVLSNAKQHPKGLSQGSYQQWPSGPLHSSEAKGEWVSRKCNHPSHHADQNALCGNHLAAAGKRAFNLNVKQNIFLTARLQSTEGKHVILPFPSRKMNWGVLL